MKLFLLLNLFIWNFIFYTNGQTIYKGFRDNETVAIERLDGGFGEVFLDCFLDSLTTELFTGEVVCYFNGLAKDTFNIIGGKAENCLKVYDIYLNYPTEKREFIYIIRSEMVQVELIVKQEKKLCNVNLYGELANGDFFIYNFCFKSKECVVKRMFVTGQKRKKQKFRISKDENIYQFLINEGWFPDSIIDVIKAQKLLEQKDLDFYFGSC